MDRALVTYFLNLTILLQGMFNEFYYDNDQVIVEILSVEEWRRSASFREDLRWSWRNCQKLTAIGCKRGGSVTCHLSIYGIHQFYQPMRYRWMLFLHFFFLLLHVWVLKFYASSNLMSGNAYPIPSWLYPVALVIPSNTEIPLKSLIRGQV